MESGAHKVSRHDGAGSSEATIEIKIKTMDSQTYSLRVDKQMSVPALKQKIYSVTGVVTEHQRLICRGKVLKDDQLLSAYHVEDGHTLHLVVREPASSSSESFPADSAFDQSSGGNRGQFYQVAPGIVVETFNMPGQGDRVLPDISRIISTVLGSIGVTNPVNSSGGIGIRDQGAERPAGTRPVMSRTTADMSQTQADQPAMSGQNDSSRLHNAFGFPEAVPFGSLQAPVVPDALTTLSQYLSHMSQEFINNGRSSEHDSGASAPHGNDRVSSSCTPSESAREGLPSPLSLAELLSSTRQMLNQQTEECLLRLTRELENHVNITDPAARASAQSTALRTGVLLQNLGAYFLELGRTVTTVRLGRSPSEAVVNAGPAVFISPTGPNPIMVQPLPFQPGANFGTPISGSMQSGAGLIHGLGTGFFPRRIDIQIRRGSSSHQMDPSGTQPSSGQRTSSTNTSSQAPTEQPASRPSDTPSSNNGVVRILPLRTMMAAVPDLNRLPSESPGGPMGLYYPVIGRYPNVASGNLSSVTEHHVSSEQHSGGTGILTESRDSESAAYQHNVEVPSGNGRVPPGSSGQRESVASRTIDIVLSAGGIQSEQNSDGQIPPGILQFLRSLFPGGEFHVESASSQGTAMGSVTEQGSTSGVAAEEAETRASEEGIFLSRVLQQIMPHISQDAATQQNVASSGEDTSQQKDGATSSTPAAESEVGTSRCNEDSNAGPNPKRQKME